MNPIPFSKTNRLIRKSVMRAFPACFAATLAGTMILMVDSLLAGALISQLAIAAVAIGNPITGVFRALNQTIGNGAAVGLTVSVGRGNRDESSRIHSLGLIGSFAMGSLFTLIAIFLADLLVLPFGGAGNNEAARLASIYLRASALSVLGSSINIYFGKLLATYGCQRESFLNSFASVILNTATSILFVLILPDEYAIAGLGIGTCIGSFQQLGVNLLLLKVKHIPLKFSFYRFTAKEWGNVVRLGFPTASNNLIDGLISGLINNIILAGFGGDTTALSIYTAVKGVFGFATSPALSTTLSTGPLFGLLYGARDKNGIRRTLGEGCKIGLVFSVVWCAVMLAVLPILLKFFGMADSPIARNGVYITFCFIPVILGLRMMTTLFESTEKPGMGLLYSVVPDSVIYPIMLVLLMPILGYIGIWIAYGANGIVFFAMLYLARSLKNRTLRMSFDRLLCLDESIRDNVPMLDFSITAGETNLGRMSELVQGFMKNSGASDRTAYMTALSLEEIAADLIAHAKNDDPREIMDIKLFSDDDCIRIVARNAASPYNPLDSDESDGDDKTGIRMVQKVAEKIEYSYVYRMNVITMDLARKE